MLHNRFVCADCGVKWFAKPSPLGRPPELMACAACGGALLSAGMSAIPDNSPYGTLGDAVDGAISRD